VFVSLLCHFVIARTFTFTPVEWSLSEWTWTQCVVVLIVMTGDKLCLLTLWQLLTLKWCCLHLPNGSRYIATLMTAVWRQYSNVVIPRYGCGDSCHGNSCCYCVMEFIVLFYVPSYVSDCLTTFPWHGSKPECHAVQWVMCCECLLKILTWCWLQMFREVGFTELLFTSDSGMGIRSGHIPDG